MSPFRLVQRWTTVLVAIVLLNLSLTFYNVWPTPRIRWQGHLSAELAAVIVGLAVWLGATGSHRATAARDQGAGRGVGGTCHRPLPGRDGAGSVRTPHQPLLGRAALVGAVASMLTDSIPATCSPGGLAAAVAGLGVAYFAARWALGRRGVVVGARRGIAGSSPSWPRCCSRCGARERAGGVSTRRPGVLAHRVAGVLAARAHPGHAARQRTPRRWSRRVKPRSRICSACAAPTSIWCSSSPTARSATTAATWWSASRRIARGSTRTCGRRAARSCRPSWTRRPSAAPRGWRTSR